MIRRIELISFNSVSLVGYVEYLYSLVGLSKISIFYNFSSMVFYLYIIFF